MKAIKTRPHDTPFVDSRPAQFLLFLLCIAAGISALLVEYNYSGILWNDEIYQSISVKRYGEAPLGVLVYYLGHLWTSAFGFNIPALRLLTILETILAVGVSSCYLYSISKNLRLTGLAFLAGCVLMRMCGFFIYNWDSGTYLFDAIAVCLLLSLITRPSVTGYLLLGITIGCMTMGRLTSGLFLPLSMVIIFWSAGKNGEVRPLKASLTVGAGWLAFVLLATTWIMGSPAEYVASLAGGNIVSNHSPLSDYYDLFRRLTFISFKSTYHCAVALGCVLLPVILRKIKNRLLVLAITAVFLFYSLLVAYQLLAHSRTLPLMLGGDIPIGLGLLLAYPVYRLFRPGKPAGLIGIKLWAVFFLLVSMSFGSDAYFERWTSGFLLPLIIAVVWQTGIGPLRSYVKYLTWLILLIYIPILLFQFLYFPHATSGETTRFTEGPLEGAVVQLETREEMEDIRPAVDTLKARQMHFAVVGNHLTAEFLYGPLEGMPFHEFHDYVERWKTERDTLLPRMEAFVYSNSHLDPKYLPVIDDIKKSGFTDSVKVGGATILYRPDVGISRFRDDAP